MPRSKAAGSKAVVGGGDDLADRIRTALPSAGRTEKRMFGGVGFMVDGNMVMGTFRGELLVRVGKDQNDAALQRPGTRPMEMRGRPMAGYVMVDPATLDEAAMKGWSRLALSHIRTLPAKPAKSQKSVKKGGRSQ